MTSKTISIDSFSFFNGIKACIPTMLGYWSIGFAAGSIGSLSGFNYIEIILLSGLLYAGSAQFLFYGMVASGADASAILLSVFLINIRYLLMSSSLSSYFKKQKTWQKFLGGALLTDETFGVAAQFAKQHGILPFDWLFGLNITAYINWVGANIVGAALAKCLPISLTKGLTFSLTAMFVGLLLLNYQSSKYRKSEFISIFISIISVSIMISNINANETIILSTVLSASVATFLISMKIRKML